MIKKINIFQGTASGKHFSNDSAFERESTDDSPRTMLFKCRPSSFNEPTTQNEAKAKSQKSKTSDCNESNRNFGLGKLLQSSEDGRLYQGASSEKEIAKEEANAEDADERMSIRFIRSQEFKFLPNKEEDSRKSDRSISNQRVHIDLGEYNVTFGNEVPASPKVDSSPKFWSPNQQKFI